MAHYSDTAAVGTDCIECKHQPQNQEQALEVCDLNSLSLTGGDKTVSCTVSLSKRDISSVLSKFCNSPDPKYQQISQFDLILEVVAPKPHKSTAKPLAISTAATMLDVCNPNIHPFLQFNAVHGELHDELQGKVDAVMGMPYQIYSRNGFGDMYISETFGLLGIFWMFENTLSKKYAKNIFLNAISCGKRDDGELPNKALRGLVRVYRDDDFSVEFKLPPRLTKSKTASKFQDGSSSASSTDLLSNNTYSKATESGGNTIQSSNSAGDWGYSNTNDEGESSLAENVLVVKANGTEIDVTKKINDFFALKKMIYDTVDVIKQIKDSAPQLGVSGDLNLDFFAGTISAKWGLGENKNNTGEYVFLEPQGKVTMDIVWLAVAGKITGGVISESPEVLNWCGVKAWDINLSLTIGFSAQFSTSTSFNFGCNAEESYKKNDKGETLIAQAVPSIKPTLKAILKVNVKGLGVEAGADFIGSFDFVCNLYWPFSLKYQRIRNKAYIAYYYTSAPGEPSPAGRLDLWEEAKSEPGEWALD